MEENSKHIVLCVQRLVAQIFSWKQVSAGIVLVIFSLILLGWWGLLCLILATIPFGGWAGLQVLSSNKLWQSDSILDIWRSLAPSDGKSSQSQYGGSRRQNITVNTELKAFVQNVMRDFVLTWYGQLSEDEQFTEELFSHLEDLSVSVTNRLSKVSQHVVAEQCLRQFHKHYHIYHQTRTKLGLSLSPAKSQRSASHEEFVKTYFSFTSEHIAGKSRTFEIQYLESTVKTLSKLIFPKMVFDCKVGRKLLEEIITYKVIYSVVNLLSEPDFLYRAVVRILSDGPNPKPSDAIDKVDSSLATDERRRTGSMVTKYERKDSSVREPTKENTDKYCLGDRNIEGMDEKEKDKKDRREGMEDKIVRDDTCDSTHKDKITLKVKADNLVKESVGATGICQSIAVAKDKNIDLNSSSNIEINNSFRQVPRSLGTFKSVQPTNSSPGSPKSSPPMSPGFKRSVSCPVDRKRIPPNIFCEDVKRGSPNTPFEEININAMFEENSHTPTTVHKTDVSLSPHQSPKRSQSSVSARILIPDPKALKDNVYHNLCIPKTEVATEYRSSKEYTLYLIEYSTVDQDNPTEFEIHSVKRRYREFLNLHSRLEENKQLRKHLKDLKEPNRLFTLPLGNMNKDYVEHRRRFLEVYIQGLLSKPDIQRSTEVKEFLAFESDPYIAYVKKAPDIVPRIDRMIVQSVAGFIDTLKTALPSVSTSESQEASKEPDDLSMTDELNHELESTNSRMFAFPETMYHSPVESMMEMYQCEINFNSDGWYPWQLSQDQIDNGIKILGPRPQGDGCDVNDTTKEKGLQTGEIPLTTLTQHLLCETFQHCHNSWLITDKVQQVLAVVTGKLFNSWVFVKISELTTQDRWAYYMFKLREAVWDKKTNKPRTEEEKKQTKKHAHECLIDFFPDILRKSVGEEEYCASLYDAMESLEYPRINRHFIYNMLDIALDMVAPEIKTVQLQTTLLENKGLTKN
ncbi:sorting nexin-19-like [Glandiceps talaboti]